MGFNVDVHIGLLQRNAAFNLAIRYRGGESR